MPLDDEDVDSEQIRIGQKKLLERIATLRNVVVRPEGSDPNLGGMTESEIARQLVYDTIEALTRADIALQMASDIIYQRTQAQIEENRLKLVALKQRERQLALEEVAHKREQARRDKTSSFWNKRLDGVVGWFGIIAYDQRVVGAIVGAIAVVITGAVGAWASGWTIDMHHEQPPQIIENHGGVSE